MRPVREVGEVLYIVIPAIRRNNILHQSSVLVEKVSVSRIRYQNLDVIIYLVHEIVVIVMKSCNARPLV